MGLSTITTTSFGVLSLLRRWLRCLSGTPSPLASVHWMPDRVCWHRIGLRTPMVRRWQSTASGTVRSYTDSMLISLNYCLQTNSDLHGPCRTVSHRTLQVKPSTCSIRCLEIVSLAWAQHMCGRSTTQSWIPWIFFLFWGAAKGQVYTNKPRTLVFLK